MVVAGLQGTNQFGSELHKAYESVNLSSGRNVPKEGENRQRSEAIVLSGLAANGGKAGCSQW